MLPTKPTMSVETSGDRLWAPEGASEAALFGSVVCSRSNIHFLYYRNAEILQQSQPYPMVVRISVSCVFPFLSAFRSFWCRQDHSQHGPRGVPGVPWHSLLHPGWRQHPPGAEQEPGLQPGRPRGEHQTYRRGGPAVCWCRAGLHRQLHLSL